MVDSINLVSNDRAESKLFISTNFTLCEAVMRLSFMEICSSKAGRFWCVHAIAIFALNVFHLATDTHPSTVTFFTTFHPADLFYLAIPGPNLLKIVLGGRY